MVPAPLSRDASRGGGDASNMAARFRRHPLAVYFVLTNVISWAFELPLVANAQGWAELPVPMGIHYLASVGPMLSAIVLTAALDESPGLR